MLLKTQQTIENAIENDIKETTNKKPIDSNNNTIVKNKSTLSNSSSSGKINSTLKENFKSSKENFNKSQSSLVIAVAAKVAQKPIIKSPSSESGVKKASSNLIPLNPFLADEKNPFSEDLEDEYEKEPPKIQHIEHNTLNVSTILNASKDSISNSLIDWCNEKLKKEASVTNNSNKKLFSHLVVNDFSTSWTNGLAFCAIMHHYRPNLIDLDSLDENDFKKNLKQAFNAADQESIMRVVDIGDILNKKTIDQLSIMTYLYQIKNHFEFKKPAPVPVNNKTSNAFSKLKKAPTLPNYISTPMSNKVLLKSTDNKISIDKSNINPFEIHEKSLNPFEELPEKNFESF